MKDQTLKTLQENNLETTDFLDIEDILSNNMIYGQDEMIIDILKLN